jgi:hypothetical protein
MARSSPLPSMGCSVCAPQSRADDAVVAQELDQLMSTALERPTKAQWYPCNSSASSDSTLYMALAPPRLPLRISGIYAGDRPPSRSGSCQRGRGRGMHRPRSSRPCSKLPGLSWRLRMQNVAHFAILTWPVQIPPPTFFPRSNNTKAGHGGSVHLTDALR